MYSQKFESFHLLSFDLLTEVQKVYGSIFKFILGVFFSGQLRYFPKILMRNQFSPDWTYAVCQLTDELCDEYYS
jgi:hypothetical protein